MKSQIINKALLVLVGPTAIGKTALSLTLAQRHNCEIISVDSMQVYRYMDIGTAKATEEERRSIVHHLIDIINPDENYDAARFREDSLKSIRDIHSRGKIPLLTGGTGMYLQALLHGIFPAPPVDEKIRMDLKNRLTTEGCHTLHEELMAIDRISAERINLNDSHRVLRALEIFYASGIPWSRHLETQHEQNPEVVFSNILKIGLTGNREELYDRINIRCQTMIDSGLENEVRNILEMGFSKSLKPLGSIGYRHIIGYLDGKWSQQEMMNLLERDTRRYAKRQYTWFTKMADLHWFNAKEISQILSFVDEWLKNTANSNEI